VAASDAKRRLPKQMTGESLAPNLGFRDLREAAGYKVATDLKVEAHPPAAGAGSSRVLGKRKRRGDSDSDSDMSESTYPGGSAEGSGLGLDAGLGGSGSSSNRDQDDGFEGSDSEAVATEMQRTLATSVSVTEPLSLNGRRRIPSKWAAAAQINVAFGQL
jgi:hypothetical protein